MEKVTNALEEIKEISGRHNGLSHIVDEIDELEKEMQEARVCTPIIGRFSTGKSALINTLLRYNNKILKENITAQTAIPAEIIYNEIGDEVEIIKNDGSSEKLEDISKYREYEANANSDKCARVSLCNDSLKYIPDVMIVDMPGFESGIEVHDKAIDNYLQYSSAYIIAFAADDMIVKESVGNILKELHTYKMPICIVITKYDKRGVDFEVTFDKLKADLKKYIGDDELRFCKTSSLTAEVKELEQFLHDIQEDAQEILGRKYKGRTVSIVDNVESYLVTALNNNQLSKSELEEKKDKLEKDLASLDSAYTKEKDDFDAEMSDCIEEIKSDVQRALVADESTLVSMIINKQDINGHINTLVRNTVASSAQKRFTPRVEKYLKRVNKAINIESVGNINISVACDTDNLNKVMTGGIVAAVALKVATLSAVTGPFAPVIAAIAGLAAALLSGNKRNEAKQQAGQRLRSEAFPKVIDDVSKTLKSEMEKQVDDINSSIEQDITKRRTALNNSLSEVEQNMNEEKQKKDSLATEIDSDLHRLEEIKNDLR